MLKKMMMITLNITQLTMMESLKKIHFFIAKTTMVKNLETLQSTNQMTILSGELPTKMQERSQAFLVTALRKKMSLGK